MFFLKDTKGALDAGADEIDLVICYKDYLQSAKSSRSCQLVHGVKEVIQQHGRGCLKVILETGDLCWWFEECFHSFTF